MTIETKALNIFILSEGWSNYALISVEEVKTALSVHEGIFDQWVAAGYQADMHYLEKMKADRFHPQNKLPDVQSVIVLMAWYGTPDSGANCGADSGPNGGEPQLAPQDTPLSGIVARYARGRDYHKILKKKLLRLSNWLKEQADGVEAYLSVDSGPTVDRVLAQAAGLGFFGKNANLIDPRKGSYFFIASLMTNLKLPPTEKQRMPSCGDCRRCIVACPTDAIVAPGVIDARRCISYLTIENKGGIPLELRSKIGNRIFGCDICQEVCPFNEGRASKQEILIDPLKSMHGVGECLNLKDILSIETDEQFLQKFAGTPLMRAKRRGLLRNACIVAGNSGDKTLIPHLQKVVDREGDEMLKEHAKWGIEQLRNEGGLPNPPKEGIQGW